MLKQLLVGGSLCAGLGLMALPARAQSPSPAPAPETQPAPAADVSQSEVQQFANTIKQIRTIEEGAQEQANQILTSEQMSQERFGQIVQAMRSNPPTEPTPEMTSQERQSFDRIVAQLGELGKTTREQIDQAIQTGGLERDRFVQIFSMVQQDTELRQQVQEILQN
jgi:hypothetical protein